MGEYTSTTNRKGNGISMGWRFQVLPMTCILKSVKNINYSHKPQICYRYFRSICDFSIHLPLKRDPIVMSSHFFQKNRNFKKSIPTLQRTYSNPQNIPSKEANQRRLLSRFMYWWFMAYVATYNDKVHTIKKGHSVLGCWNGYVCLQYLKQPSVKMSFVIVR